MCVMNKKAYIALLLALSITLLATAQEGDTSRWDFHMSTGATVATGFGRTQSLGWVAPSVSYRFSDRLKVSGGLAVAGSLLPAGGYTLHGRERSLAPRREGTKAGAMWVSATYHPNDRLWLWGSVMHVTGYAQPLWLDGAMPIEATAISGGVEYKLSDNSLSSTLCTTATAPCLPHTTATAGTDTARRAWISMAAPGHTEHQTLNTRKLNGIQHTTRTSED